MAPPRPPLPMGLSLANTLFYTFILYFRTGDFIIYTWYFLRRFNMGPALVTWTSFKPSLPRRRKHISAEAPVGNMSTQTLRFVPPSCSSVWQTGSIVSVLNKKNAWLINKFDSYFTYLVPKSKKFKFSYLVHIFFVPFLLKQDSCLS